MHVGGGEVLPTPFNKYPDTSQVCYSSTQFCHYLPRESIGFHGVRAQSCKNRLPTPQPQKLVISPMYHLCFWPTSYGPNQLTTPFLALINVLEWLMELKRSMSLATLVVYQKRTELRNSQLEEMRRAERGECVWSIHAFSQGAPLPKSPHVHPPTSCLLYPSFWDFAEISVDRPNWLSHWPLVRPNRQPVPLAQGRGCDFKF